MGTKSTPFFPDEQAYTSWIQSIPAVMRVLDGGDDELAEDVDGPYYYSPHHLILRVNRSYCALVRVGKKQEANFFWYNAGTRDAGGEGVEEDRVEEDGGEEVFAAYLWNRRARPPEIVGGETIQEARAAITSYLGQSGGRATVRLVSP